MTLETIYYIGQTVAVVLIFGSLVAINFQQRPFADIVSEHGA